MKRQRSALAIALRVVVIALASIGTVLYTGGYFPGGLVLLAAGPTYLGCVYVSAGADGVRKRLVAFARDLGTPLVAIAIALLIGAIVLVATGFNPLVAYGALFHGALVRNWHISVLNASPVIFTALSVAFAFKAGLFNIGAEGQYYVGAMAAAWIGLYLPFPAIVSIPIVIAFAAIMGAAWNLIPAFLKVRTGAHEVITTMMLAHTARFLSNLFIRANGGDPANSPHPYRTTEINVNTELPRFQQFMPEANFRAHTGILLAIVVALLVHYILTKTRVGFAIRAVGHNKDAARAQGISVAKITAVALLGAGALSALAGVNQVNGLEHRLLQDLQANFGWNGISVALLAGGNPIAIIFTGFLWGALDAGGQFMQRTTQITGSIVEMIKGLILFLIVARRHLFVIVSAWWSTRRRGVRAIERPAMGYPRER